MIEGSIEPEITTRGCTYPSLVAPQTRTLASPSAASTHRTALPSPRRTRMFSPARIVEVPPPYAAAPTTRSGGRDGRALELHRDVHQRALGGCGPVRGGRD